MAASLQRLPHMFPKCALQRLMSTARPIASNVYKFIVFAPDKTDDGAYQRRLSVRTKHLERSTRLHESGSISTCPAYAVTSACPTFRHLHLNSAEVGGAMLTPESIETPTSERKMVGSVLIMEAESLAAARKTIEEDIYYTAGVVSRLIIIIPSLTSVFRFMFNSGIPKGLLSHPSSRHICDCVCLTLKSQKRHHILYDVLPRVVSKRRISISFCF